jgi:hypothetical protein
MITKKTLFNINKIILDSIPRKLLLVVFDIPKQELIFLMLLRKEL